MKKRESHGCNRFKPIYIDRIANGALLPVTKIEILKETPTTVVMDGNNGMGMVASHEMMEMPIEKAPGQDRICTAGEKEWLTWQERKDKGVPVGESIQKEMIAPRDKLGLDYHFPFEN